MEANYLFTSERLGFRNWTEADLDMLVQLNADSAVMEHFPKPLSRQESVDMLRRLQDHYKKRGHTYYAVEVIATRELIGFIGLAYQEYETDFTPATDIGWRLKPSAWGQGFATEGAKRCLDLAFNELKLTRVISTCTLSNKRSEHVMKKIGMSKRAEFNHPRLKDYPQLERCLLYEMSST